MSDVMLVPADHVLIRAEAADVLLILAREGLGEAERVYGPDRRFRRAVAELDAVVGTVADARQSPAGGRPLVGDPSRFLTVDETCGRLGVSRRTVGRMLKDGRLVGQLVGQRTRLIDPASPALGLAGDEEAAA